MSENYVATYALTEPSLAHILMILAPTVVGIVIGHFLIKYFRRYHSENTYALCEAVTYFRVNTAMLIGLMFCLLLSWKATPVDADYTDWIEDTFEVSEVVILTDEEVPSIFQEQEFSPYARAIGQNGETLHVLSEENGRETSFAVLNPETSEWITPVISEETTTVMTDIFYGTAFTLSYLWWLVTLLAPIVWIGEENGFKKRFLHKHDREPSKRKSQNQRRYALVRHVKDYT